MYVCVWLRYWSVYMSMRVEKYNYWLYIDTFTSVYLHGFIVLMHRWCMYVCAGRWFHVLLISTPTTRDDDEWPMRLLIFGWLKPPIQKNGVDPSERQSFTLIIILDEALSKSSPGLSAQRKHGWKNQHSAVSIAKRLHLWPCEFVAMVLNPSLSP